VWLAGAAGDAIDEAATLATEMNLAPGEGEGEVMLRYTWPAGTVAGPRRLGVTLSGRPLAGSPWTVHVVLPGTPVWIAVCSRSVVVIDLFYLSCDCLFVLLVCRCPRSQARFRGDACAAGISLSADRITATKTDAGGSWTTNVLLTRPSPGADGSLVVTWRHEAGGHTMYGWALPDLNPTTDRAFETHGSFVYAVNGALWGLGTKGSTLPGGAIPVGATLSLRYDPARGTMHARVNGGAEHPCFTDLRNDLVPAVCLYNQNVNATCAIVD
jgi:hypothetical protein